MYTSKFNEVMGFIGLQKKETEIFKISLASVSLLVKVILDNAAERFLIHLSIYIKWNWPTRNARKSPKILL